MLAHLKDECGKQYADHHRRATAIARGGERIRVYGDGRPPRKSGEFCEIECHRIGLNIEIIAHEVVHATFRWADRVGLTVPVDRDDDHPDCSDEEERFCYALGRMTNTFAWQLRRRGVWKRPMCNAETFDPADEDTMASKKPIKIKKSHEGLLHKETKTPKGKNIPESKIKKAEHSKSPAERKRAVFAENFGHRKKKGK